MRPNVPLYVTPKEKAERRAYYRRFAYWTAVVLPLVIMLMLIGYSDQAPSWLRTATEALDAMFGYPLLRVIALIAG
jgi:hypothetical protein